MAIKPNTDLIGLVPALEAVAAQQALEQQNAPARPADPYAGLDSDALNLLTGANNQYTGTPYKPASTSGSVYGSYSNYTPRSYESRYQSDIDRILGQLANRRFSYNYENDPLFQQYRKQYTIGGERAMEDTLGRVAARTGGLASSYAGSAAQQAYNEYMTALSGKIPELQQIAYNMYTNEGNDLMNMLNAYRNLENDNYERFNNEESRLAAAARTYAGSSNSTKTPASTSSLYNYTPSKTIKPTTSLSTEGRLSFREASDLLRLTNGSKADTINSLEQSGRISSSVAKELYESIIGMGSGNPKR